MNSPTTSHGSGRFHQKNDGNDGMTRGLLAMFFFDFGQC